MRIMQGKKGEGLKGKGVPRVIFQPETSHALRDGITMLAGAIRPTLGPSYGTVAIDYITKEKGRPELLDSGGVIARRIIELGDASEDMGAMLLRAMVCRQHDEIGDGTATATVLFEAIYKAGLRYVAAGGNGQRLRYHLEQLLPLVLGELERQTYAIDSVEDYARIAESLSHDPPMAEMMGEIFDVIGEYGQLDIRKDNTRGLRRDYVEGIYFNSGLLSRVLVNEQVVKRIELVDTNIFICDFTIDDPRELFPVIECAVDAKLKSLVIFARNMNEAALSLVHAANRPDRFQALALKIPDPNPDLRNAAIEDLSVLTGTTPLLKVMGHTLESVTAAHFGRTRRFWATSHQFGLHGPRGNPRQWRRHLLRLEEQFRVEKDKDQRDQLEARIGKLLGGSATLFVGGSTEPEIEIRKNLAERAATSVRMALREGVLPGCGLALMNVRPALEERLAAATEADERAAIGILLDALATPTRTIYENAGYNASDVMAKMSFAPPDSVFDVLSGEVVDLQDAGILDCATVVKRSTRNAISTAALALTIDVLVHLREPEMIGVPT